MEQSKLSSLIESLINILIGYVVALLSQLAIFPMVGIHIPLSTNLEIGAYFTLVSLVRSYVIRRWFNKMIRESAKRLAGKEHSGPIWNQCGLCHGTGLICRPLRRDIDVTPIDYHQERCFKCMGLGRVKGDAQ